MKNKFKHDKLLYLDMIANKDTLLYYPFLVINLFCSFEIFTYGYKLIYILFRKIKVSNLICIYLPTKPILCTNPISLKPTPCTNITNINKKEITLIPLLGAYVFLINKHHRYV